MFLFCTVVHWVSDQMTILQREWAEAKKELQEERDIARTLTLDREQSIKNAMRQVEEMGKDLSKALHDVAAAETRAAVAEVFLIPIFSPVDFLSC